MIHTFSDRIKVVSNIETGLSKILRDGNVINSVNNPAITEYEKFLKQVAEDANKLKEFSAE